MKTNRSKTPKSTIIKTLAASGLSVTRTTVDGVRVWKLSDGRTFASLAQMADQLKVAAR